MPIFVMPFLIIDPVAVQLGPLPIRWYALAYLGGFAVAWVGMRYLVSRETLWLKGAVKPSREGIDDLVANVALGVIIGGRLGHVLIYDPKFYFSHPIEILQTWKGGMAFHGGLVGAIIGMMFYARRSNIPFLTISDLCATVTPAGLFFGRLANFIKPEMWGRASDAPWAMVFPTAGDLPRHPSQLYEAGLEGLILGGCLWAAAQAGLLKRPGLITGLFGIGYGLARIFCEFFREPDPVQEALSNGLTMGMVLSLPLVFIGVGIVFFSLRRRGVAE